MADTTTALDARIRSLATAVAHGDLLTDAPECQESVDAVQDDALAILDAFDRELEGAAVTVRLSITEGLALYDGTVARIRELRHRAEVEPDRLLAAHASNDVRKLEVVRDTVHAAISTALEARLARAKAANLARIARVNGAK